MGDEQNLPVTAFEVKISSETLNSTSDGSGQSDLLSLCRPSLK